MTDDADLITCEVDACQICQMPSAPAVQSIARSEEEGRQTLLGWTEDGLYTSHVLFHRCCISSKVIPNGFQLNFLPRHSPRPSFALEMERILFSSATRPMTSTVHFYTDKIQHINAKSSRLHQQLRFLCDRTVKCIAQTTPRQPNPRS